MRSTLSLVLTGLLITALVTIETRAQTASMKRPSPSSTERAPDLPKGVTMKDAPFFSDGIQCRGTVFLPATFSETGSFAAVVVAPGWTETALSVAPVAARLAAGGIVAMTLDYRGWGRSGGYPTVVDDVRTDDRLRFSQMTARIRIERLRLLPLQQVIDIRNALYYLQGEKGVDRSRVGVWGTDMSGGHAIVIAGIDPRVKAVVAQSPLLDGKDKPKRASAPPPELLKAEQKRARYGESLSASGRTDAWAQIAQSEYHPYWSLDQIPSKTAVLFVIGDGDPKVVSETVKAASQVLKGPANVASVPNASRARMLSGASLEAATKAAVEWFLKYL